MGFSERILGIKDFFPKIKGLNHVDEKEPIQSEKIK